MSLKYLMFFSIVLIFLVSVGAASSVNGPFIEDGEDSVWAFYSPDKTLDNPSNNFNVVLEGDKEEYRELLQMKVNGGWSKAEGTERYAYVNGEWVLEDYQLEKGHYFTTRYHLRGYKASNMTLIQAHYEHFDWFSLSHEVESNVAAREFLVDGLENDVSGVEMFRSEENRFLDSDGWIAAAVLISFFATLSKSGYSREILNYIIPLTGFIILFAVIRLGSIGLYGFLSPHQIFTLMYPVILVGMPALAFFYGGNVKGFLPGVLVFSGFILAVLLEYLYLGVESVPFEIIVMRISAAFSLAMITYGSTESTNSRPILIVGIVLWMLIILTGLKLV